VAFNVFFGRPTLTGEHHDTFADPRGLVDAVRRINTVAPDISWTNLETVASRSFLRRRTADGTVEIRACSPAVTIENESESVERYSIAWDGAGGPCPFQQVLRDGLPFPALVTDGAEVRALTEIAAGACHAFSAVCRNGQTTARSLGPAWEAKAFLRRRLSEIRDNHLSKNPHVLNAVKTLRARFLSG